MMYPPINTPNIFNDFLKPIFKPINKQVIEVTSMKMAPKNGIAVIESASGDESLGLDANALVGRRDKDRKYKMPNKGFFIRAEFGQNLHL